MQRANRNMKKCPTSLIEREMQIKTMMRGHVTPIGTASVKKTRNSVEGCRERGTSCTLVGRHTGAAAEAPPITLTHRTTT